MTLARRAAVAHLVVALLASAGVAEALSVSRRANGTVVITDGGTVGRPGHLWRDDASWLVAKRNAPSPWDEMIAASAREFGVDPILVKCMMLVESGFNPRAVSPKGAKGLMQLMPKTAAAYGVIDVFDPAQNIRGGVRYLNFLLNLFNGNLNMAIAGYNAGEGAVARYGTIPPYNETQDYVRKVLTAYNGTPYLSGGKFRTDRFLRVDVRRDPGRPVFAWFDPATNRRVISSVRPPADSVRLTRLARGR